MVQAGGGPVPEVGHSTAASDAPGPPLSPLFAPLRAPGTPPIHVSETSYFHPQRSLLHFQHLPAAQGGRKAARDEVSETSPGESSGGSRTRARVGAMPRSPGS